MAPFAKILCAVEGSQASTEAARQAVALAAPPSELKVIAVKRTLRQHLLHPARLSDEQLEEALRRALEMARQAGVSASSQICSGRYTPDVLLAEGQGHDLTVIGSHGHSRAAGISRGRGPQRSWSTKPTEHFWWRAGRPTPRTSEKGPPRQRRLVGVLGTNPGGNRTRQGLRLRDSGRPCFRRIALQAPQRPGRPNLCDRSNGESAQNDRGQSLPTRSSRPATQEGSSLVVIGHRGVWGLHAVSSVSERVAHRAPCSVLLAPDGEAGNVSHVYAVRSG